MDAMEIFRGNFSHIDIGHCVLHLLTRDDCELFRQLFRDPDVKRYYVLRDDHSRDIGAFHQYLLDMYQRRGGFTYIITARDGAKAGFISVEFDREGDSIVGNTSYAILKEYRNTGLATAALTMIGVFLTNSQIDTLVLDINLENEASMAVARAAYYVTDRIGYLDPEHPDAGPRKKWRFNLNSQRLILFREAQQRYVQKDYDKSIELYEKALEEVYLEGTPFTDAQIYMNLGMAYSANEEYRKAYDSPTKAESLGLHHHGITKELQWLTAHRYLW